MNRFLDTQTGAEVKDPTFGTVTGNLTGNVTGNVTGNLTGNVTGNVSGLLSITRNAPVAAAGSTAADAAAVAAGFTQITGADATKGVILPTAPAAGTIVWLKNNAAAVLKVWPDVAATVNAVAAHGALSVPANTAVLLIADSTTQWWSLPLLPS